MSSSSSHSLGIFLIILLIYGLNQIRCNPLSYRDNGFRIKLQTPAVRLMSGEWMDVGKPREMRHSRNLKNLRASPEGEGPKFWQEGQILASRLPEVSKKLIERNEPKREQEYISGAAILT